MRSTPTVAFALRDSTLYLTGIGLNEQARTGRIFTSNTNIRIPIAFTDQSAATWKVAYAEKHAAAQKAADQVAKTEEQVAIRNQTRIDEPRARDPIYVYAQGLVAQMRPLPACQIMARQLLDLASSSAPAFVRERQVEAMFNHIPKLCVR